MPAMVSKVSRGAPLKIKAEEWNAVAEAVNFINAQRASAGAKAVASDGPEIILVRNNIATTGDTKGYLPRGAVVGLDGPIIDPANNLLEFTSQIALEAVDVASEHLSAKFAVTIEPIPPGAVGRAIQSGTVAVKISIAADADTTDTAGPEAGNIRLVAGTGNAAVLWVQPIADREDATIAWAYVKLGGGGSSLQFGVIVCEGPDAEANFTDERYWVDTSTFTRADADDPYEPSQSGSIVERTNIHEMTTHSHALRAGTVVAMSGTVIV